MRRLQKAPSGASRSDHPTYGPAMMASALAAVEAEAQSFVHREKEAAVGDQLNPLIAWYSLVAKPVAKKLWATMPRAQAAVDAEWKKLREADGGRGTCDESQPPTEYWQAQREAKD